MSYLIAMYVLVHGNNLSIFGYIPGQREERPRNQGLLYKSESELSKVLPDDIASSIVEERKRAKLLDYESILREAIESSQNETAKIMQSSINMRTENSENVTPSDYTTYEDEFSDYDMSFFNEMNGLKNNNDDDGMGGFPW